MIEAPMDHSQSSLASRVLPHRRRRSSLAGKLTSMVTVMKLLTGVAVGIAYFLFARAQLSSLVRNNLSTVVSDRQALLQTTLTQQQVVLELIASRTQLRRLIEQFSEGQLTEADLQAAVGPIVADAAERLPFFSALTICTPSFASLLPERPMPEARPETLDELVAAARNRALISPFETDGQSHWALGVCAMFGSRQQLLGYVVARIDESAVVERVRSSLGLGAHGEVLVGHRLGKGLYLSIAPKSRGAQPYWRNADLPELTERRPGGVTVGEMTADSGQRVVAAFAPVGYRDWGLWAQVDRSAAYESVREIWQKIVLIQLAALGLTLLGAHWLAGRLTRPIHALTRAADAIAAGDWSARVPAMTDDEIGVLALQFNAMADRLASASAELERKVVERTAELARSEAVLRSERELLRSILDNLGDGVLVFDAAGKLTTINPAAARILGRDAIAPEAPLAGLEDCWDEEGQRLLRADESPWTRIAQGEEIEDVPCLLRRAGASHGVHLSVSSRRLYDDQRQVRGVVAVVRDVSEGVRSRRVVESSRRQLQEIIDNSPAVIYLKAADGRYLLINREFRRIFQLDAEQIVGHSDSEIFPADTAQLFMANDARVRVAIQPMVFEEVAPHFDGPHTYVSVKFPLPGNPGEEPSVCGISTDITERKQMEQQLRESTERFERVIRGSTDGIWDWDPASPEAFFSPRWKEMLGYADDELPNRVDVWESLLHPDDKDATLRALHDYLEGRSRQYEVEFRLRHRDGHYVWILSRGVAQRDAAGRVIRMSGSHVDVTERKRYQEEIERSARELARSNADLQQFAYIASHDLQEPLRMVNSYVQLLAKRYQGQLDQDADDFIGFAVSGVHRMQGLINDLLAYSRAGGKELSLSRVDLNAVLREVQQNLEVAIREAEVRITAPQLPVVLGDRTQLAQLLQNLLSNAIRFRSALPPHIEILCQREATNWRISVRDNGIGFDPKYAQQIFMVFKRLHSRARFAGSGIGLSICQRIVERHGGRIWAESKPGEGSTFHFTLPSAG